MKPAHKSPLRGTILSHMNPVHNPPPYFFKNTHTFYYSWTYA
jgi:hypothetical protein